MGQASLPTNLGFATAAAFAAVALALAATTLATTARALHNDCGLRVDRGQCHLGVPFGLRACNPALRFEHRAVARRASTPQNILMPSRTRSLARSRVLCTQASAVAVSGSYAYVTAHFSLVVVDISNPASPAVRGSVVSSSLLNGVREAGELRARMA